MKTKKATVTTFESDDRKLPIYLLYSTRGKIVIQHDTKIGCRFDGTVDQMRGLRDLLTGALAAIDAGETEGAE